MGACESSDAKPVTVTEETPKIISPGEDGSAGVVGVACDVSSNVSISQASDDRGSFVRFIKNASADEQSPEFRELRQFLTQCFVDCDTDFDGLIGSQDFDKLVERAGAMPRKWGFAPTTAEMFANEASKIAFRAKTFKEIDTSGVGTFALDEWVTWCLTHISLKSQYINYSTAETKMNTNKGEFKDFIVAAAKSRHCPEYKELYHFLQDCFMKADQDTTGFIDAAKFDKMIEMAADAPRKFGFAPPTSETYANDDARIAARTKMFKDIAAKNKRGYTDKISFNAWLDWAYTHICEKAKDLDSSLTGEPPAMGDLSEASYGGAKHRSKLGADRGISAELASNNKEMFIKFIKAAAASKESPEYQELHYYLLGCFVECDQDFDGLIREEDFDNVVERAAALPRKWGFAPTTLEQFKTAEQRISFRSKTFKEVNKSGSGAVHFDEWLEWSYTHICGKAKLLDEKQAQSKMETSAADFKAWVIAAAKKKESPEYKELYHFLHDCFMRSCDESGLVDAGGFDRMIETAAMAPRRFGFAPATSKTYKSDAERVEARRGMFEAIASRNRRAFRDKIPFQSWLGWAYAHICAKAKELDSSLSGFPPGMTAADIPPPVAPPPPAASAASPAKGKKK